MCVFFPNILWAILFYWEIFYIYSSLSPSFWPPPPQCCPRHHRGLRTVHAIEWKVNKNPWYKNDFRSASAHHYYNTWFIFPHWYLINLISRQLIRYHVNIFLTILGRKPKSKGSNVQHRLLNPGLPTYIAHLLEFNIYQDFNPNMLCIHRASVWRWSEWRNHWFCISAKCKHSRIPPGLVLRNTIWFCKWLTLDLLLSLSC